MLKQGTDQFALEAAPERDESFLADPRSVLKMFRVEDLLPTIAGGRHKLAPGVKPSDVPLAHVPNVHVLP